MALLATGN
uniref:Uncharacterized protein n=1 Tax=Arundo donax TaxID=35708 RepID=A0A0A8YR23_ARUDO